ncbi:precorrin-6Y C5,15-methyltransferase (decarboxylating) subunit CbiT [Tessaracoccus antarcticus]|uniref:Precorrin-6Y C5,15-methyltransferase (Decarboxylating) subunit CbiT n=1 Tax=Tessaracoccus antarcticus TaxID=2479848 RepID=A0A3M0GD19_9ACTN|nr:precorrin-6Y C5,15-methyltransferase (decarboxylating) subunit CbiT [Tessaracoccus antarcticus]
MVEDPHCHLLGRTPGLPDEVFEHDGLITKRHIRATALAHLRPLPGELLWDVGAGAGSVAVEWCRAAEGARAIGIERNSARAARVRANAERLTEPGVLQVVEGSAAGVLDGLPVPDAVFIGGGGTVEVVEHAVARLRPGGRVVVHGITIEAELVCVDAHRRWGGQLSRMQVETAQPLGSLTGWQPARTVIAWVHQKRSD